MTRQAATPAGFRPGTAYLIFAAVVLIWGTNWPIMKVGLTMIPPFWFAFMRVLLGVVTLFVVLAGTGKLHIPRRHDLPVILSVGCLQVAVFLVMINLAVPVVGAGRSAILAYTTPLWVLPGAIVLLGERPGRMKLAGFILSVAGIAILFNPAAFDWRDPAQLAGNGFLLLAALSTATAILHVRSRHWHGSPLQLTPWQLLVALPPMLAAALLFEEPWRPDVDVTLSLILLHNGVLATGFCYWGAFTVTRALPAISTSLGFLGVPLVGVASAALALGEPLTASIIAGLLAILGGLALVNLSDLRPRR